MVLIFVWTLIIWHVRMAAVNTLQITSILSLQFNIAITSSIKHIHIQCLPQVLISFYKHRSVSPPSSLSEHLSACCDVKAFKESPCRAPMGVHPDSTRCLVWHHIPGSNRFHPDSHLASRQALGGRMKESGIFSFPVGGIVLLSRLSFLILALLSHLFITIKRWERVPSS